MKDQVNLMMRLVAVAAYLVVGAVPYFGSPLVAPPASVALLWGLWLAGWVLLVRAVRNSPKWAWAVSLVALLVWVGVVLAGEALFGWQA